MGAEHYLSPQLTWPKLICTIVKPRPLPYVVCATECYSRLIGTLLLEPPTLDPPTLSLLLYRNPITIPMWYGVCLIMVTIYLYLTLLVKLLLVLAFGPLKMWMQKC